MRNYLFLIASYFLFACSNTSQEPTDGKIKVVCTTSIMTDWVSEIAADNMEVIPLLKVGVDPHVYKPSKRDLDVLRSADVIIYHGLHLEGKIIEVLDALEGKLVIDAAKNYPQERIIRHPDFPESTDPHVWFDSGLVKNALKTITEELALAYPEQKPTLMERREQYLNALDQTVVQVKEIISTIPQERRLVITTHDALSYFARDYGFRVETLQGASTVSEFGLREITDLVDFIVNKQIPAIFLENIVSPQAMESVQRGCADKGFEVTIGPELLSDSLGSEEDQNTYLKMLLFNANTIAAYLK